jgi:D-amino-acid oxidase
MEPNGAKMTDVLVVGAGVIGLTTAVCLAEAGASVTIWAKEGPLASTSAAARGLWVPGYTSERELRWSLVSFQEFSTLLDDPAAGVRMRRGLGVTDLFDQPQEFHNHLPELEVVAPEDLSGGFPLGWWSTVPLIDMPRYLGYLARRFQLAGGRLVTAEVHDFDDCFTRWPLVVNCTGVGARALATDPEVYPVRGQHVVVRNPGIDHWYMEGVEQDAWTGFFPHGGKVLLAGVSQRDNWSTDPSDEDADGILARCAKVEPRLADATVISQRVGLRAARSSARLEVEERPGGKVVHCYGHSGFGVSQSWGCARAIERFCTGASTDLAVPEAATT